MRFSTALVLALAPLAPCLGQPVVLPGACHGEIVTQVDIHSYPPGSSFAADAWKTASSFAGIHHVPTRSELIRAYIRVAPGKRCTELDRSESERLLRAQPFIASATVRPLPDGPGAVRILVETVDEIPLIVGGSFQGTNVRAVLLGTENLDGRGLTIEVAGKPGYGYRPGFGGDVIKYGAFGRPFTLAVGGQRDPLGDALRFEFSKPFLTDLQANGFHLGANELSKYYRMTRPIGDDVFLDVRRVNWDVGVGTRAVRLSRSGVVGVIGGLIMGEDANTASQAVFMTDSAGLVPAPGLPEVDGRYTASSVVRAGAFAGIRALRYQTVRGFDALTAAQDIGMGVEFVVFAAPSIWASPRRSDFFLSGELYAGIGNPGSFMEMRIVGEGRTDRQAQRSEGVVGFAKIAWYRKPAEGELRLAQLEFSAVQHLTFPLQLTFFDHEGGLPGFQNARTVGGQRAILRLEERHVVSMMTRRADWAVALFADAGRIWAGDVPFGQTSAVRASVGVSLLGAYPAGGKRTYRIDFAMPVNPDGSKFEIRFSSSDLTRGFWRQPNDLAVAHSAESLQNLGSWTPH